LDNLLKKHIRALFEAWAGEPLVELDLLPQSGSDRQYFRAKSTNHQVLVAYNSSKKENKAFVDYTGHFRAKGVSLPEIYAADLDNDIYLVQDLGDIVLLDFLEANRTGEQVGGNVIELYKKALTKLAYMQIEGSKGLDVEAYHSPASFDQQAMLWDGQYFKYCFLKPSKVEFDEHLLESNLKTLTNYLATESQDFFMFRDFQARNIMLAENDIYFIDYQGGKRGPLQYDVVSLLFQAKANLPNSLRQDLLDHYINEVSKYIDFDVEQFRDKFYGFVLIRTLQVLGAYGFKGLYERKAHFIASIPFALRNLFWLLNNISLPIEISHLKEVLLELISKELKEPEQPKEKDKLTVRVQSFSYKRGIPEDPSGNGGGFVFDCRFIHNPGRYQPYKKLTGRDQEVIDFFKEKSNIDKFVIKVEQIVDEAVDNYIERGFGSLCINFGCTGGQHRSVFSADYIAKHLQEKYPINVILHHREQERKNWKN
jgi:aminoglycoside/choline kinase family phosphotransferase